MLIQPDTRQEANINEQTKDNYAILLSLLMTLLEDFKRRDVPYVVRMEIMKLRAFGVANAGFQGYGKSLKETIKYLNNQEVAMLTYDEMQERAMLVSVLDNLLSFGIASQFQLFQKLDDIASELDDAEFEDAFVGNINLQNNVYANVEDADAYFAMAMALGWGGVINNPVITYYTQGDERVRESHRPLHGISYLKSEFPRWLIPPIDWACRCYLDVSDDTYLLSQTPADALSYAERMVNPIFTVSPWNGGQIFGNTHPYFNIPAHMWGIIGGIFSQIKKDTGLQILN